MGFERYEEEIDKKRNKKKERERKWEIYTMKKIDK